MNLNYFKHGLLLVVGVIYSTFSYSQIEKGGIDISAGIGFGIYGSSYNDPSDSTGGVSAASAILNLSGNYSVTNNFIVGLNLERNGFAVDSAQNGKVVSLNARINLGYRLVNTEANSFAVFGQIGMSNIHFSSKSFDFEIKSTGPTFVIGFDEQHFFNDRIGYFLKGGWAVYSYSKMYNGNKELYKYTDDNGNEFPLKLSLYGVNLGVGLVVKY